MRVECAGQTLELMGERALSWPGERTLFVADLHLGKPAAFRAAGIPVPEQATSADLLRLSAAVIAARVQRLVILGDLFHARSGLTVETFAAFEAWREAHAGLRIELVRGNHDRSSGDPPGRWRIECRSGPVVDGPFVLAHEPAEDDRGYVLSGHIHPAVRLCGAGAGRARASCFWFSERCAVLPAFGSFTGSYVVRPRRGDRLYAAGEGHVVEVKLEVARP